MFLLRLEVIKISQKSVIQIYKTNVSLYTVGKSYFSASTHCVIIDRSSSKFCRYKNSFNFNLSELVNMY
jgi:hypothetical protein